MGIQVHDEGRTRAAAAVAGIGAAAIDAASRGSASVRLAGVHMSYGRRPVLRGVSCDFPAGAITVVLGGSGSGKSTILKLIGGLIAASAGSIEVAGQNIVGLRESDLYVLRRRLGMMFQNGALLDSMSVFDNLAFPLREHAGIAEKDIADRVHQSLAAVGLEDVDDLLPRELSGGMVKRVALARALVRQPDILLVDEPFSGLDPLSTKLIEALLVRINRSGHMTMIVVSHHIPSTIRMADRIVLLLPDAVIEGAPGELQHSADARVRRFLTEETDDSDAVLASVAEFEQGERRPERSPHA
ncbi:MAG TPA: ATP-binding cassette domain-containing protein [Candidatus Binatia bacterium]